MDSPQVTKKVFPGFKRAIEEPDTFPNIPAKIVCIDQADQEWVTRALFKVNPLRKREKELYVGLRSPSTIESVAQVLVDVRFYETAEMKSTGMGFTLRLSELDDFKAALLKISEKIARRTSFGGDGRRFKMELKTAKTRETFKYVLFELESDKSNNEVKSYKFCLPYTELIDFHLALRRIHRLLNLLQEIEGDAILNKDAKENGLMVFMASLIHYFMFAEEFPGQIMEKIRGNEQILEKWKLVAPLFGIHMSEADIVGKIEDTTSMAIEMARSEDAPEVSIHVVEAAIELMGRDWKF